MKINNIQGVLWLVATALLVTGCSESVVLAGNGLSMVVAVVLLWSTVNWNRAPERERAPHGVE